MKALLLFFILTLSCTLIESVVLNCNFLSGYINALKRHIEYSCSIIREEFKIISDRQNQEITEIQGGHVDSATDDDVKLLLVYDSKVLYFPLRIQKFFIHLDTIIINYGDLRELRKDDLKGYTNLRFLNLSFNNLEILEPNLFDFNQKLEEIDLKNNKISHIDPHIFNKFANKLKTLDLRENVCEFDFAKKNKQKANEIIQKVRTKFCKNQTILEKFIAQAPKTTTETSIISTTLVSQGTTRTDSESRFEQIMNEIIGKHIEELKKEVMAELKTIRDELKHAHSSKRQFRLPQQRLVGGKSTEIERIPYIGSLQLSNSHICGCNIISSTFILTAAHCTYGSIASEFQVRVGSSYHYSGGELIQVKSITQHHSFNPISIDFDYSILELEKPITFDATKQPIALPNQGEMVEDGTLVVTSGWGETRNINESNLILRTVEVPLVNQNECKEDYDGEITARMICAGYREGGKDSCQGDSGGPLAYYKVNDDGTVASPVLIGLVSWGQGCANPNQPGIYSRVSYVADWLRSVTNILTNS